MSPNKPWTKLSGTDSYASLLLPNSDQFSFKIRHKNICGVTDTVKVNDSSQVISDKVKNVELLQTKCGLKVSWEAPNDYNIFTYQIGIRINGRKS
jgi:hypothetical protein